MKIDDINEEVSFPLTGKLPDIKPQTQIASVQREKYSRLEDEFEIGKVAVAVGMAVTFIRKVCGRKKNLTVQDVFDLLDQDCYRETIVPRSRVIEYLIQCNKREEKKSLHDTTQEQVLLRGHVLDHLGMV